MNFKALFPGARFDDARLVEFLADAGIAFDDEPTTRDLRDHIITVRAPWHIEAGEHFNLTLFEIAEALKGTGFKLVKE